MKNRKHHDLNVIKYMREYFRSLPMLTKLQYSFTLPIVFCITIVFIGFSLNYEKMYRKELVYSVDQANAQAAAFFDNYLRGMLYVKTQLQSDATIQRIVTGAEFGKEKDLGESYREFFELNNRLIFLEMGNPNYRLGLYLPDETVYAQNRQHFYPLGEVDILKLKDFRENSQNARVGFIRTVEVDSRYGNQPREYLTLIADFDEARRYPYLCKVSVEIDKLQQVHESAGSIQGSQSFLINKNEELVIASEDSALILSDFDTDEAMNWSLREINEERYYAVVRKLGFSDWEFVNLIPVSQFQNQTSMIFYYGIAGNILLVLLVFHISKRISRYYVNRLNALNEKMSNVGEGNLVEAQIMSGSKTKDEMDQLDLNFEMMSKEIIHLMREQYRLGKKISETQLNALQAQINPHFLYNTLDLINWGALDFGAAKVAKMARDLGMFYRLSLNHGSNVIRIADEIRHVTSFVDIENVHFEDAIALHLDIPEKIREFACLNILLQPFVENSILHGIGSHPDIEKMNIRIRAQQRGGDILFEIEDDGPGVDEEEMKRLLQTRIPDSNRGYGINNVNFRLKLCYGEGYGIEFANARQRGTIVRIRIKAMEPKDLRNILDSPLK